MPSYKIDEQTNTMKIVHLPHHVCRLKSPTAFEVGTIVLCEVCQCRWKCVSHRSSSGSWYNAWAAL